MNHPRAALACLLLAASLPDGSLDPSFGGTGLVELQAAGAALNVSADVVANAGAVGGAGAGVGAGAGMAAWALTSR